MREQKFRWFDDEDYTFVYFTMKDLITQKVDLFEDCIIDEYTGLKDKNGKEIYENDIIQHYDKKSVIVYDKFYGFIISDCESIGDANFSIIEVIGNIYENPELLEA